MFWILLIVCKVTLAFITFHVLLGSATFLFNWVDSTN